MSSENKIRVEVDLSSSLHVNYQGFINFLNNTFPVDKHESVRIIADNAVTWLLQTRSIKSRFDSIHPKHEQLEYVIKKQLRQIAKVRISNNDLIVLCVIAKSIHTAVLRKLTASDVKNYKYISSSCALRNSDSWSGVFITRE